MNNPKEVDKLTPEERDLIEHFRQTRPGKRQLMLAVAADYRRIFPIEVPTLRLVPVD